MAMTATPCAAAMCKMLEDNELQALVQALEGPWDGHCQQANTVQKGVWLVMLAAGCGAGCSEHADYI